MTTKAREFAILPAMKVLLLLSFLSLSGIFAAETAPPPQKDAKQLLQEGLFEEEANRDFKKAADAYRAVVAQFDAQRNLVATSLFRLAEVEAKGGDKAAAVALYQRLLRDFSTEEALVKLSQERLVALGEKAGIGPGGESAGADGETKAIAEYRKWIEESPDRLVSEFPLAKAVGEGWLHAATFLLDHGVKIDPGTVVEAAAGGRKALLELLLDRGANPNTPDGSRLPLETACHNNSTEVVRLLLEKGAQPNASVGDESTPLILSIRNPEITTLLLDHGADPNLLDPSMKITPLVAATDSAEVTKLLLQHHADPDLRTTGPHGTTPLFNAIRYKRAAIAELLLASKADPNEASEPWGGGMKLTPLEGAIANSIPNLIPALVQAGADPNARDPLGTTALEMATERGSLEIVNTLLAAHADPNTRDANGNTALHFASSKIGDPSESVEGNGVLASALANGRPQPDNPLEIKKRAFEIAKRLLEAGADPRIQNENGADALHVSISRYLLQPRSDESSPDFRPGVRPITIPRPSPLDQSPPRTGVRRPATRIVTPNPTPTPIETPQPVTPDTSTEERDSLIELWTLLVAKGADLNAPTKSGNTPLRDVLRTDATLEHAEWLIDHGADLSALDDQKQSPLSGASINNQLAIAKRYLFPKWIKSRAISVMRLGSDTPEKASTFPALTDFDAPPEGIDVLLDEINPGITGPNHSGVANGAYRYEVSINRRDATGNIVEIGRVSYTPLTSLPVKREDMRTWPALQWGDVLVLEIDRKQISYAHDVNLADQSTRPVRKVTIQISDQAHTLNLGLSRDASFWSATSDLLPAWRLSELTEKLVVANPHLRLDQVKLERTIEGNPREWTVDLRGEGRQGAVKPLLANLMDGDRLVFTQAPAGDADTVALRKNRIVRFAPGGFLGETAYVHEKDPTADPHTLCELIADAYCDGPMLIPNPDFTHIVIHRLKNDSGEQEDIPVNLAESARTASEKSGSVKGADINLKWGDAVEIPALRILNEKSWDQLDVEKVGLLTGILRRDASVQLPHGARFSFTWTPQFRVFGWDGEIPGGGSPVTPDKITHEGLPARAETIAGSLGRSHVDLEQLSRVDVHSGDKTRQISIEELRKSDPKFRDGDVIEPVLR